MEYHQTYIGHIESYWVHGSVSVADPQSSPWLWFGIPFKMDLDQCWITRIHQLEILCRYPIGFQSHGGTPIVGWFMEHPSMDDWGYPQSFWKPPMGDISYIKPAKQRWWPELLTNFEEGKSTSQFSWIFRSIFEPVLGKLRKINR